jgi:hypothetical protein
VLFDHVNKKLRDTSQCTPYVFGDTKYYAGWHRLWLWLGGGDKNFEDGCGAFDVKQWDSSLFPFLLQKTRNLRAEWLCEDDRTDDVLEKMVYVYDHVINAYCVLENGYVYQTTTGNKSGTPNTSSDNCLINMHNIIYVYIKACVLYGKPPEYDDFCRFVKMKVGGDDNIFTVHKEIRGWFTLDLIKAIWLVDLGLVTTQESMVYRRIEECEFLSQDFHYAKDYGLYVPVPRPSKMLNSLICGSSIDDPRMHMIRAHNILLEVYWHEEARAVLRAYIQYLKDTYGAALYVGVIKGVPAKDIAHMDRSDAEIENLYIGNESKCQQAHVPTLEWDSNSYTTLDECLMSMSACSKSQPSSGYSPSHSRAASCESGSFGASTSKSMPSSPRKRARQSVDSLYIDTRCARSLFQSPENSHGEDAICSVCIASELGTSTQCEQHICEGANRLSMELTKLERRAHKRAFGKEYSSDVTGDGPEPPGYVSDASDTYVFIDEECHHKTTGPEFKSDSIGDGPPKKASAKPQRPKKSVKPALRASAGGRPTARPPARPVVHARVAAQLAAMPPNHPVGITLKANSWLGDMASQYSEGVLAAMIAAKFPGLSPDAAAGAAHLAKLGGQGLWHAGKHLMKKFKKPRYSANAAPGVNLHKSNIVKRVNKLEKFENRVRGINKHSEQFVFKRREEVMMIQSSETVDVQKFAITPLNSDLFADAADIAPHFQRYDVLSIKLSYRRLGGDAGSTSTLGRFMIGTVDNAQLGNPSDIAEMVSTFDEEWRSYDTDFTYVVPVDSLGAGLYVQGDGPNSHFSIAGAIYVINQDGATGTDGQDRGVLSVEYTFRLYDIAPHNSFPSGLTTVTGAGLGMDNLLPLEGTGSGAGVTAEGDFPLVSVQTVDGTHSMKRAILMQPGFYQLRAALLCTTPVVGTGPYTINSASNSLFTDARYVGTTPNQVIFTGPLYPDGTTPFKDTINMHADTATSMVVEALVLITAPNAPMCINLGDVENGSVASLNQLDVSISKYYDQFDLFPGLSPVAAMNGRAAVYERSAYISETSSKLLADALQDRYDQRKRRLHHRAHSVMVPSAVEEEEDEGDSK